MSQGRFRTLNRLHESARDDVARELGRVLEAIDKLDSQRRETQRVMDEVRDAASTRTGDVSVQRLLDQGRYQLQLEAQLVHIEQAAIQLRHQETLVRQRLMACETECRKYERLETLAMEKARASSLRREQLELDDFAGIAVWNRKRDASK